MSSHTPLLLLLLVALISSVDSLMLENDAFEPVKMNHFEPMTLRLSFDELTTEGDDWNPNEVVVLTFNLTDKKSRAMEVMNESLTFSYEQIRRRKPQQLFIKGINIGLNKLQAFGHIVDASQRPNYREDDPKLVPLKQVDARAPDDAPLLDEDEDADLKAEDETASYHVRLSSAERTLMREVKLFVVVESQTGPQIFTLVMTLMVICNTVNMGGQLDLDVIKKVFKKPIGPIVGFISQFLFMPLFSFGIGWLMSTDKLFRLGLFVLGCCPGGTGSNFWCILLGGDINLSITMTFISTIAALGMMPLWLYLMGPLLTDGALVIPFGQLIMTLILLIAPTSLGMWLRYRWAKSAVIMGKIIVPFTLLTVLFIFTAGVYINMYIFVLIDGLMVAAGFLVAGAGYLLGGLLAWVFRLNRAQITAVSIETAFQNGGIAFIILKVSLPEPFGELSMVAPVSQLVITGLPLWALLIVWKLYSKVCRVYICKREPTEEPINVVPATFDGSLKGPGDEKPTAAATATGTGATKSSAETQLLLQSQSVLTSETDVY